MTKLPKIYHDNRYIVSNNRCSYRSINEDKPVIKKEYDLFSYLNRVVTIKLDNGETLVGKVLSIRDDTVLLNSGVYINTDNIVDIK